MVLASDGVLICIVESTTHIESLNRTLDLHPGHHFRAGRAARSCGNEISGLPPPPPTPEQLQAALDYFAELRFNDDPVHLKALQRAVFASHDTISVQTHTPTSSIRKFNFRVHWFHFDTGGVSHDTVVYRASRQLALTNQHFERNNVPIRLRGGIVHAMTGNPTFVCNVGSTNLSQWREQIVRIKAAHDQFDKQTDRSINVFVCAEAGGLPGMAQFPFQFSIDRNLSSIGLAEADPKQNWVFLHVEALPGGSIMSGDGTTFTHELGHYFGLYHVFQDNGNDDGCAASCPATGTPDNDRITETPPMRCKVGCPVRAVVQCNNQVETLDNMMGYTSCRSKFVPEQVTRMTQVLITYRPRLSSRDGCELNPCGEHGDCFSTYVSWPEDVIISSPIFRLGKLLAD